MESQGTGSHSKPKWYHVVAAFFAGIFLTNTLPHFINGITGHPFPTPFADPPGKGLSSPVLNVGWATINAVVGFTLLIISKVRRESKAVVIPFAAGCLVMAFYLAFYFGGLFKR